MNFYNSVRFKIFIGFLAVIAPLVFFQYYNNYYATHVVKDQISANYQNVLAQYSRDTDNILWQTNLYLFQMSNDPDISNLYSYRFNDDEYNLSRVRILNKLSNQLGYFNMMTMFFIYSETNNDLILASQSNYPTNFNQIKENMPQMLSSLAQSGRQKWQTIKTADGFALTQTIKLYPGIYAGAWVDARNLGEPLQSWQMGENGGASIMSDTGDLLFTQLPPAKMKSLWAHAVSKGPGTLEAVDPATGDKMLLIQVPSDFAEMRYVIAVNERNFLKSLPYFQYLIYLIPVAGVIVILLYMMFLQRVFFRPLADLIRGMRRLAQGRFDFRLDRGKSSEFNFLVSTFNDMAAQIENLKINVYEEKLKVQQAEFKQLQVQINPHFYMNSLNIVYNLAALKNFKSVQRMALYLADYFRFTMRSSRDMVSLAEELQHVRNYLEIQQLRYPGLLEYDIPELEEQRHIFIPPLTIQPFVENAIIHGLSGRRKVFRIEVAGAAVGPGAASGARAGLAAGHEAGELRPPGEAGTAGARGDPSSGREEALDRVEPGAGTEGAARQAGQAAGYRNRGGGGPAGLGDKEGSRLASGTQYEIRIVDNGKGFSAEMLELLQTNDYMARSRDEHVGIWNVLRRLRMQFGEGAEYAFRNRSDGEGAEVILRLPLTSVNPTQEADDA